MTGHINCTTSAITLDSFNPQSNYNYLLFAKLSEHPGTQQALKEWYPLNVPPTFKDFEVHYLNEKFLFSFNSRVLLDSFGHDKTPITMKTRLDEIRIHGALDLPQGIYLTELYLFGHKIEKDTEIIGDRKTGKFEVLPDTDLEKEVLKMIKELQKAHH